MASYSFLRAKREAQGIIKRCHITRPDHIDLEAIAALHNVYPSEGHIQGADARLLVSGNTGIVTIRQDIPEPGRKRFALAHDVGHFILHRLNIRPRLCDEKEFLNWYRGSQEEPEANVFAAELIMPEAIFSQRCKGLKPGFDTIMELATIFNTSMTSTAFRYVEVGNYPIALIASSDGKISWFAASPDFGFRIRGTGTMVNKDSCAGDFFFRGSPPPLKPEPVDPTSWLEDYRFEDNRSRLYEHALALTKYGIVLSLIWQQ